jgi:DNA polymerase-3 subunit epsilon
MRQIALTIETTGLDPQEGHRIVELAAVELIGGKRTGDQFHRYFDPERELDPGAQEVHGLSREFLSGKVKFADAVADLLDVIRGTELVVHNSHFDLSFLSHELELAGAFGISDVCPSVVDTLRLARDEFPGQRNSLSALCDRLGIETSGYASDPGALIDAICLSEIYRLICIRKSARAVTLS